VQVLEEYQMARLTAFLEPGNDLGSAAYQVNQSKIAIGSGNLTGKGVEGATQTADNFLPEHHTDFIFAVVGEQRGFVGTAVLLGLYVVVVWRAARSVTLAASLYESLIAAGIAGMFLTQIFVNIGMTIGIMPTTGIPLPFMTYGGSNTIVNLAAVGLLCAIQLRGAVPLPPPLASHEVVVSARRRLGSATPPAPLVRR
jgi:rod shape determining protein RodA